MNMNIKNIIKSSDQLKQTQLVLTYSLKKCNTFDKIFFFFGGGGDHCHWRLYQMCEKKNTEKEYVRIPKRLSKSQKMGEKD